MAKLDHSEAGLTRALSVLTEAGGDVTEEKFEQVFAGIDLSYLLNQPGWSGTVARILAATPADVRLVAASTLAAYIDHLPDLNPAVKFLVVAALRAAPQGITAMLSVPAMRVDLVAVALETKRATVADRQVYVGAKRTDLIHDVALHPPDAKEVINQGSLLDILNRCDRNPLCPFCFAHELRDGRIKIEAGTAPPPAMEASAKKSKLEMLTDAVAKIPEHLRPLEAWLSSWVDNEGASGDVKARARAYAAGLLKWGKRLLIVAILGLIIILGLAVVFMLMSIYGIFWAQPVWILVGMVGIIVLRFVTPLYDIPLNMFVLIADFLDPTDGTGMIGGTIGRFMEWVAPDRKKTPAEDREPIAWFTDKAVSVSVAWALVTAFGCLVALIIDPLTAPPAATLMLSGSSWLYFMLDTLRRGWKAVGKNDENRYIPASLRKRFYKGSIYSATVIGLLKFAVGFGLAVSMGIGGTGKLVTTSQTVGERAVVTMATARGVTFAPTVEECQKGLASLTESALEMGTTVQELCATNRSTFPCTCPAGGSPETKVSRN